MVGVEDVEVEEDDEDDEVGEDDEEVEEVVESNRRGGNDVERIQSTTSWPCTPRLPK